jgi:hypothetical protein
MLPTLIVWKIISGTFIVLKQKSLFSKLTFGKSYQPVHWRMFEWGGTKAHCFPSDRTGFETNEGS